MSGCGARAWSTRRRRHRSVRTLHPDPGRSRSSRQQRPRDPPKEAGESVSGQANGLVTRNFGYRQEIGFPAHCSACLNRFRRQVFCWVRPRAAPILRQEFSVADRCCSIDWRRRGVEYPSCPHRRYQRADTRPARRAAARGGPQGVAGADGIRGDRQSCLSCTRFHPARRIARRARCRGHARAVDDVPGDVADPGLPAVSRPQSPATGPGSRVEASGLTVREHGGALAKSYIVAVYNCVGIHTKV